MTPGNGPAILLLTAALAFVPACRPANDAGYQESPFSRIGEPLWETPEFSLVNCDGRTVSKADLIGKVWLAAFIFTRCPGPCPLITRRMSEVQRVLSGKEDFRLVSFTVDPAHDRPEVLLAYARARGADPKRWVFLTSPEPDEETMHNLANEFKIAASRVPPPEGELAPPVPNIVHGTNILLVDRSGQVRAIFDSENPDSVDKMTKAIAQLNAEK